MKNILIKWFQDLLGITKLIKDNKIILSENHQLRQELRDLRAALHVCVDINHPKSGMGNWAVICVAGKSDYVRLFNGSEKTIIEIKRFLKNFDDRNMIIDLPIGIKKGNL